MLVLKAKAIVGFLAGALLGLLSVIAPTYLLPDAITVKYDAPLVPVLMTAFENLAIAPTLFCFVFTGLLLGFFRPQNWLALGISTVSIFPLIIGLEIALSPTSHNLWPFEIGVYALFGLLAVVGAYIGRLLAGKRGTPP